jgi:hypothetical protein
MKKFLVPFLVLALLAVSVAVSADTPAPGGPFNTAFRVQNLGAEDATCTFAFYDDNGTAQYQSGTLDPIPPGDSMYVYVPTDTDVDPGMYSGVVSCSQEVAAVANFSDANSGASYSGISGTEVATTLFAPGIYDNYFGFYSNVVVQNASSGLNDIRLQIYEPGNTTAVYDNTQSNVPANAFVTWEQEGMAQLDTDQFYSAKISGTGNIAAIVNIYGRGAYDGQLYSYNTFASGAQTVYAPVIMNAYYGYNTALVVQNMGSSTASVTITYSDSGSGSDWSGTIDPGGAISHYTPDYGVPAGQLVGAKVISSEDVAVIVNESTGFNRAGTYSGFASGSGTVNAPVVMNSYYFWNSSVTCQNVGSGPANMSISYTDVSGSYSPEEGSSIAVGDVGLFYQPAHISSLNWIGSAVVTSDEDIVCVVNQDQNGPPYATQSMDQLFVYNGVVQ